MNRFFHICANILLTLVLASASHGDDYHPLSDPAQETRAQALFRQLRCVVCGAQSLADSNAMLAVDMRDHIRKRIVQGETDQKIIMDLANQYGAIILLAPPLSPLTWALWFFPLFLLGIGGWLLYRLNRRRNDE